ncbi:MAG: peptidoglycan-binding protein [Alphaproteobacteria bacterium]|nr:peptidoglycan-binding protein [Alphaproteobacteria bacterium]
MIDPDHIPFAWARRELSFTAAITRGHKGKRARLVQELLTLAGHAVAIDAGFGPATEAGVRGFQKGVGLALTGSVDAAPFAALTAPLRRALTPIDRGKAGLGALVVRYAEQHADEHPREVGGQNAGPWVRLYMHGNEGPPWAWCGGFVSLILRQACDTLGLTLPIAPSFSCYALAVDARHRGILKSGAAVTGAVPPGSLFLQRRSASDWVHTGIVVTASPASFATIEGNTNDAGDREGYEVCRRIRSYESKDFVVLPAA